MKKNKVQIKKPYSKSITVKVKINKPIEKREIVLI